MRPLHSYIVVLLSSISHPFPFYKSHTLLVIPLGLHYIYITLIVNLLYSLRRSYTLSLVDCWCFLPASYIIAHDGKYEAPSGRVYSTTVLVSGSMDQNTKPLADLPSDIIFQIVIECGVLDILNLFSVREWS